MNSNYTEVAVVFDMESTPPVPLGTYWRTQEDVVFYFTSEGEQKTAPCDCVRVAVVLV